MTVYAVVRELIGHNSARSVVEEDIDTIRIVCNLLSDSRNGSPVCQIAVNPLRSICFILPKLLCYSLQSSVYDFFRQGQDVELLDVVVEQGVREAIANAWRLRS